MCIFCECRKIHCLAKETKNNDIFASNSQTISNTIIALLTFFANLRKFMRILQIL